MVLFVGSNPSSLNKDPSIPFVGSKSEDNLKSWLKFLIPSGMYRIVNVSDKVTKDNRPLKKSEYELLQLSIHALNPSIDRVVALGNTASDALDEIGIKHFKLPHPSPRNRFLNNKIQVQAVLDECKKYIGEKNA